MRFIIRLFLGLTLVTVGPALAQDSIRDASPIVDFGIYSPDNESSPLLVETDTIPAVVGTVFGIRITLDQELISSYSYRWTFPEMRNPADGRVWTEMTGSKDVSGDSVHPILARINHDWEAVPGDWTLQVFSGDQVLVEKVFRVVAQPKEAD